MSFLRKRKKRERPAPEAETTPIKHPKKRKVTPVEVKLLTINALKAGIQRNQSLLDSRLCGSDGLGDILRIHH